MAAETLLRQGSADAFRAAIEVAHTRVCERARRISDPALQKSFLEAVPENARTMALFHSVRERRPEA